MIVPDLRAVIAVLFFAVVMLGAAFLPVLGPAALAADAVVALLVVWEGRRLRSVGVEVEREGWGVFQVGRAGDFRFRVSNRGSRTTLVGVRQVWPDSFDETVGAGELALAPGEADVIDLKATPRRRGEVAMPPVEVDVRFPLGWARLRLRMPMEKPIRVSPDLRRLREYDALRRGRALRQFGLHRVRMRGAGREFEQLREYLVDDDFRDVNWKATARRREPMTNVYQAERSQDLILALDASRMMGRPVGDGTALDRAVEASLMLSHVAVSQGDRVGLAVFRNTMDLFLRPRGGARAGRRLAEELIDVAAEPVFPSYASLMAAIRTRQKRRAMVFLFTDINDPQIAADLARMSHVLSRRHVFVIIAIRDRKLAQVADGPAHSRREVCETLAARALETERRARSLDLTRRGAQTLEAPGDALTIEAINRYLAIKMRQMI